jgi:hypothetical protein
MNSCKTRIFDVFGQFLKIGPLFFECDCAIWFLIFYYICVQNFIKIGRVVFEKKNILVNFHWLFAPNTQRRTPYAVRRAPCLISPVLIIVSSSNFIFKTFSSPGIRIFHFRSKSPDRKYTLQRSQNAKYGIISSFTYPRELKLHI